MPQRRTAQPQAVRQPPQVRWRRHEKQPIDTLSVRTGVSGGLRMLPTLPVRQLRLLLGVRPGAAEDAERSSSG